MTIIDTDSLSIPIKDVIIPHGRRPLRDVQPLAESINEIGLLNPITISPDKTLIAGLHRLQACRMLGWDWIDCRVIELSGLKAELAEIDENLRRNELTELEQSQQLKRRKEVYEALHPETKAKVAGGLARQNSASDKLSFAENTAAAIGQNERTVQRKVQIAEKIVPEVQEKIASLPIADNQSELLKIARMQPEKQKKVVELIAAGEAETTREVEAKIARQERVEKIVEISKGNSDLNAGLGTFPVIYADPPWQYEHVKTDNRAIENHYPTMPLADICALKAGELATPDAVMFMWATAPKLAEAMKVIEAWGFIYRTNMVWVKDKIGMGYWARNRHELLLIATRGNVPVPEPSSRFDSVVEAPRTEHSAKPVEFYEYIEQMFPEYRKVELFCRSPREGWAVWGNQANG